MTKSLQAIRGMNDILPMQTPYWQYLETCIREVVAAYGYQEIRLPLLEATQLFKRTIGEVTDIVEKEMYTFLDRNEESVTLRPEGTAGCVRAGIEHGLFYNQLQRLWYMGPMFRYERPQKGRYRQFHQFGVEVVGVADPIADVEVILLAARLLKCLGLASQVRLQLNTLGSLAARQAYRNILVAYFEQHKALLDEDSLRRLTSNPLRILDSKNPALRELIQSAPKLIDHLDEESRSHFNTVCQLLKAAGIDYEINPFLVRGLDYYNRTVFEWVTERLGAQGTVCAGGRYDGLVEQLGGNSAPAVGFGLGLERLALLLEEQLSLQTAAAPHLYCIQSTAATPQALVLAEKLRTVLPGIRILLDVQGGAFKNQFKRANKSGAIWAIILGDNELAEQRVGLKHLRAEIAQQMLSENQLIEHLQANLKSEADKWKVI